MFEYIFQKRWLSIVVVILLGFFFQFSLDVIFSLIYRNHSLISPWPSYAWSMAMSLVIMYGLVKLSQWMNRRFTWERSPGSRFYIQIILITLAVVVMVTVLRMLIKMLVNPGQFVRLLDEMVITVFFFIMGMLLVFLDVGINLLNKWRNSLAEIERFKKENLETQFEMLRMQVNPHFLFNSLNTLSSLIYQNQEQAGNFVRELSSVYRYILEKRKTEVVTLKEELEFTNSYIYLLGLRFENKLVFHLKIDEKYMEKIVVPLTLQILIENAVKHNVVSMKRPLAISIATQPGNTLVVRNNLQPKNTNSYSTGIGLDNIRSRLEILTDREMQVEKTNTEFVVTVPLLDKTQGRLVNW
ncbi:MAG: sensor histidine kinase [Bacteroidota bacterium]